MIDELRGYPYYDDYDSKKNYTQLLAVPGRVAQAREFTQIQSTMKDIIKNIGDSIFKDGNIIEGCQVSVSNDKKYISISAGRVYLSGMVLSVEERSEKLGNRIPITGVGREVVGIKLSERVVDEREDSTLLDPAEEYANRLQPGCHRLKSTVDIVLNDNSATPITVLEDGTIYLEKYAPEYDSLATTLARRTHDESGSYVVRGMKVRVESNPLGDSSFYVAIDEGKAYVQGYEVGLQATRKISLPRSTTHETVDNVNITYTGERSYQISEYPYVESINELTGQVLAPVQSMRPPDTNTSSQSLPAEYTPIIADSSTYFIESIDGQVYTPGVDFVLANTATSTRAEIQWKGNKVPTSDYALTYRYVKTFTQGVDYKLVDQKTLEFISTTTPVVGTALTLSYESYLARKDTVYINPFDPEYIGIVQGVPASYGLERAPEAPTNTLAIATITSPPRGEVSAEESVNIRVSNIELTRFTMNDIRNLLSRIRTLEYDQSVLALNDEARQYITINDKRGIFTDSLLDFSKVSLSYNLSKGAAISSAIPTYGAAIDRDSRTCYLPVVSNNYYVEYDNTRNSTRRKFSTVTIPIVDEVNVLSQMTATKTFLVNPYTRFPQIPEITLSPSTLYWENPIYLDEEPVRKYIEDTIKYDSLGIIDVQTHTEGAARASTWESVEIENTKTGELFVRTEYGDYNVVSETPSTYISTEVPITVIGSNFYPGAKNIKCYFDSIPVDLSPIGNTEGSNGTISADSEGKFTAEFNIPERVLSGIKEVRIVVEDPAVPEGFEKSTIALLQGTGIDRTMERTVTELYSVIYRRVVGEIRHDYIDPVGQTFVLDRMAIIGGIDLYFATKSNNTSITCDIREVVNGSITSTVLGHRTLTPEEVGVDPDKASRATRFVFEEPVVLEAMKEYAFVVRSSSSEYSLWVSELGGIDVSNDRGEQVTTNPYLVGLMMSSSNNSSWTMHQTTDIKFKLWENTYAKEAEVYFKNITSKTDFSRIYLTAESFIPSGSSVTWMYSTDDGKTYNHISLFDMVISKQMYDKILFKAVLTRGEVTNMSPILSLDSVVAMLSCFDTEGCYISRPITGLDEYTDIDIILDAVIPYNTKLDVLVSTRDDGLPDEEEDIITAELDTEATRTMNYNWKEYTYRVRLPEPSTQCRIFIKMTNTDDSGVSHQYATPTFRRLRAIMS